ncbi:choice-of-anchor Q domain-containing protein [Pseudomonas borbori]
MPPVRFTNALKFFAVALTMPLVQTAFALDLTVNTRNDSTWSDCLRYCSLRTALNIANNTPGEHTIRLPAGRFLVWSASEDDDLNVSGDLDIAGNVTIIGAGAGSTLLQPYYGGRFFDVLPDAKVTMRNLTITDGNFDGDGIAIRNRGELQLRQVSLVRNSLQLSEGTEGRGAAIANYHQLSIHRSEFNENLIFSPTSNRLTAAFLGAAIYNGGELLVRDSLFRDNLIFEGGTSSGAAIYNEGTMDIARSAFVGNRTDGDGAAVTSRSGVALISNSTFAGNSALHGGVVTNGGPAGNPANMQLLHVTIANNNAIGVENLGGLLLRNSLIIANRRNCSSQGDQANFRMRGLLLGSWTDSGCHADTWVDDGLADSHVLEALQIVDSLPVYPLRAGSPAVDTASGNCSSHDQRSVSRPRDGDGDGVIVCDLGAYER